VFTDVLKERIAADRVGNCLQVDRAWFPKRPGTSNSVCRAWSCSFFLFIRCLQHAQL